MNSMMKKLPLVITASTVVLALIAVILYQGGYITKLKQTIKDKEEKIILVSQERDDAVHSLEIAQQELQVYKDSVEFLSIENQRLNLKIDELKGTISKLNKTVQKHHDKVASLSAEIDRLKESGKKYEDLIKDLEQQREEQLSRMLVLDQERQALINDKHQQEESKARNNERILELDDKIVRTETATPDPTPQVAPSPIINQSPSEPSLKPDSPKVTTELQAAITLRQQERLNKIIQNTTVNFKGISLRNREDGNELKRVKSDDWRYTFVDFDLSNIDQETIMDEQFVLQLFDLDNKVVVPFNERNPAYPNSEIGAMGYKFKYDGKPVSVRYLNTQPKEGSNYELRLVYPKNGIVFTLVNGTKRIVEEGRVAVN